MIAISHEDLVARGPVCECADPRCFKSLGICWGELDLTPHLIHIAASCRTPKVPVRCDVAIGQTVWMEIGYSECAMSMQVAGKIMQVRLEPSSVHGAVAQLLKDGREYSAPVLVGEAGIYREGDSYYYYLPVVIVGGGK